MREGTRQPTCAEPLERACRLESSRLDEVHLDKQPKGAAPTPSGPEAEDADTRIAPDPFAAVLPALAALGAIASIAAINWTAQERTEGRGRNRRKPQVVLKDLESCCLGLQEIFRRFHRHPRLFAGEGGTQVAPMKFGVHGVRIDPAAARLYQQLVNDIASMLVLAAQNSFDVMCAVEDGDIGVGEDICYAFAEEQDRLNTLIQCRAPLKLCVETGLDVAEKLAGYVRRLRSRPAPEQ